MKLCINFLSTTTEVSDYIFISLKGLKSACIIQTFKLLRDNKPFKIRTANTFNSFHSVIKQYLKKHWMVCMALHVNIFAP